jgi:hypothetical protein
MLRVITGIILLVAAAVLISCDRSSTSTPRAAAGGDSPTDAYQKLYAAVKAKDTQAIEAVMTRSTIDFAKANAARTKQTMDQMVANGLTGTTFSPTLPQIRDERINGDMGAVEVYNSKDKDWEDLPFIREDGGWKLAIGELWANTFRSPGKSESQKEREATNAMGNNLIPTNINVNSNVTIVRPGQNPISNSVPRPPANVPARPAATPK